MALLHCDLYSQVLGMATTVSVVLPQRNFDESEIRSRATASLSGTLSFARSAG